MLDEFAEQCKKIKKELEQGPGDTFSEAEIRAEVGKTSQVMIEAPDTKFGVFLYVHRRTSVLELMVKKQEEHKKTYIQIHSKRLSRVEVDPPNPDAWQFSKQDMARIKCYIHFLNYLKTAPDKIQGTSAAASAFLKKLMAAI